MTDSAKASASASIDVMTIDEVSEHLKVPVKTIRQWVYKQQIPNAKLNGLVRFSRRDIDAWIRQSSRAEGA